MRFGDYYRTIDRLPTPGIGKPISAPEEKDTLPDEFAGPKFVGMPTNPFQHQLQALNAKIKEGAGRIELSIPGKGKGTSQAPTPESYGHSERRDIKELSKAANIKTSVHATFNVTGFSGLTERGFSDQAQEENIKELKKAVEFAAESTEGGAVVLHTGEFQRQAGEFNKDFAETEAFQTYANEDYFKKDQFHTPEKRNQMHYIVDERTGQVAVNPIAENQTFYEPAFKTAQDLKKEGKLDVVGKTDSKTGKTIQPTDMVDSEGNYIDPLDPEGMFKRMPHFKEGKTEFATRNYTWDELRKKTEEYNKEHGTKYTPALYKAKQEIINRGLQSRANSIYHGQRYQEYIKSKDKLEQSLRTYEKLEDEMGPEEVWKIAIQEGVAPGVDPRLIKTSYQKPTEAIKDQLRSVNDSIRHIHESSATSDAQAMEMFDTAKHLKTMEEVGLQRGAEGVARAGLYALEQTKRWKPKNPVYVAPENLWVGQYGSHPKEIIDLTKKSRKEMQARLEARGYSENEAQKLAKDHIKSTIDIGHLNMWKQYWKKEDPNVSPRQRDEEFKKWMLHWTKKMVKEDVLGHIHVSDNFGFDDEHLTPGEGNAPIKEFLEEMKKNDFKEVIIEPGSFNPHTTLHDSWSYLNSPVYGAGPRPSFRDWHQQQFGTQAPPFYVVGGYAPTNEWRMWSEVPLE